MAFVVSSGQVESIQKGHKAAIPLGTQFRSSYYASYEEIYRTQPAVRTVVGFMARNVAQIGVHVFDRVSDTDRVRLRDHPVARLLAMPLPAEYKVTRYKLFNDLMMDLGIYDVSLWLKIKTEGGTPGGLLRIPPRMFTPSGDSWTHPDSFVIKGNKGKFEAGADEVVYIRGYNPEDSHLGLSPMETLRTTLAEEWESRLFREQMWSNGARISGYVQRPVNAPRWKDGARSRFREEWAEMYSGQSSSGGGVPLLEDGMSFVSAGITPEQAQYIEGRKFTREEVANTYWIPPPMVGILDNASFSNITEQHKMLYQDALGPWLESIQQDLELQLLTDFEPERTNVYIEFNISEKMKGSFEEQASSISTLTGRPVLTANEGRALLNRNELPEGDGLVVPLNVLIGGQAAPNAPVEDPGSPQDALDSIAPGQAARREVSAKARVSEDVTNNLEAELAKFFERQGNSIISKVGAKSKAGVKATADSLFDESRWNGELSGVLFPLVSGMAAIAGATTLKDIGEDPEEYDEDLTNEWMLAHVSGVASGINGSTKFLLAAALAGENPLDAVKHLFEVSREHRAKHIARTETSAASSFGTHEAVKQTGRDAKKTWVVTSDRPRKSHKRINGETVGIDELFSNGGRWPGDSRLKDEERAQCSCDLRINVEE